MADDPDPPGPRIDPDLEAAIARYNTRLIADVPPSPADPDPNWGKKWAAHMYGLTDSPWYWDRPVRTPAPPEGPALPVQLDLPLAE